MYCWAIYLGNTFCVQIKWEHLYALSQRATTVSTVLFIATIIIMCFKNSDLIMFKIQLLLLFAPWVLERMAVQVFYIWMIFWLLFCHLIGCYWNLRNSLWLCLFLFAVLSIFASCILKLLFSVRSFRLAVLLIDLSLCSDLADCWYYFITLTSTWFDINIATLAQLFWSGVSVVYCASTLFKICLYIWSAFLTGGIWLHLAFISSWAICLFLRF